MDENREISSTPFALCEGRSVKAQSRTTDVHVLEKSDCAVIPVNHPNKAAQAAAEGGEGRVQLEENIVQVHMLPTLSGNKACSSVWTVCVDPTAVLDRFHAIILQKSRMRRRARTDLCGLRLETHEVQSPEMEAAVKPSSQPRTKSCVMSGDGHCEA
jgi:hypothetical protein